MASSDKSELHYFRILIDRVLETIVKNGEKLLTTQLNRYAKDSWGMLKSQFQKLEKGIEELKEEQMVSFGLSGPNLSFKLYTVFTELEKKSLLFDRSFKNSEIFGLEHSEGILGYVYDEETFENFWSNFESFKERRRNFWRGLTRILRKILDVIDSLLDSLVDAIAGIHAIKEFKDALEAYFS